MGKKTDMAGAALADGPGDYRRFTGYVNFDGIEGWAENATFALSGRRRYASGLTPDWMTESFRIVWQKGTWLGGTFYDGAFYGGAFDGGVFLDSCFHGHSVFRRGTFSGGTFYGGCWEGGRWESGKWLYGRVLLDGREIATSLGPVEPRFSAAFGVGTGRG